jgi:ribulose 1,5-bisphosphate synthetase/thiazole synthase
MGEDAASVFFLGCFENRVTLYSQQVRALNLVDAILDQQLVREHGKVAIVGGRAAGITAAAALAKAAPELQKIDLFEARGLKRTSALLNRVAVRS